MPPQPWQELRHPFDPHGATWWIQELTEDAGGVVLVPGVSRAALTQRFDAVLGVGGWGFSLHPLGDRAIVCNLRVADVERAAVAVAPAGMPVAPGRLADQALGLAAAAFGIGPSSEDRFRAVVDLDDETGEPLYWPTLEQWRDAMSSAVAAPAAGAPDAAQTALAQRDRSAAEPTAAREAPAVAPRSQGAQAIDKLVERLNQEGLGRQAARLVVAHHGYGRSPEEGRELYSKLRALLLEKHGADA